MRCVIKDRFRQCEQHFFNPVLVDHLGCEYHTVRCDNAFSLGGQTIQHTDQDAADGIIIFGNKVYIQCAVHIVQFHTAFHQILPVAHILNQLFFIFIVLVPYFTHDFFQQVLQSDHTDTGTIFIENKGHVHGGTPHLHHQVGSFLIFIGIIGFPEDILYFEILLIGYEQKVFDIHETLYIVRIVLVDGNSGIHGFPEQCQQFVVGGFHIHHCYINFRNHNVFGIRITEIKHIVNHFPFFCFYGAVFMADIHIGFQIPFCHGRCFFCRMNMEQKHDTARQFVDDNNDRSKEQHQQTDDLGIGKGDFFGVVHGPGFGSDFSEDKNGQRQCAGHKADRITAPDMESQGGW